nr:zinc finger, CCHC-type, retrotransposon Gag domain protein [Tanacetum cinerariifolium]
MVNTRTDADLLVAVQNALQAMLPRIREEIREEFRTGSGSSNAGGNPPPVTIHTWLKRFNKQKPHSFEKATAPVDAEHWISHMEKIFDVMGCEDAFKTKLAVYKFEGNALAWWKAYKQAKGGDAWLVTVTWADFKKLFKTLCLLNYALMIRHDYDITSSLRRGELQLWYQSQNALQTLLPQIRVEIREEFHTSSGPSNAGGNPPPVIIHTWLERFNKQKPHSFDKATAPVDAENWISHIEKIFDREYHSIRQTNTETSTEFMQRFLRLAGFLGAAAGTEEDQAKNFHRPLNRVVTGTMVIITTVKDQTGEAVVTTIAATTTTLVTTTG